MNRGHKLLGTLAGVLAGSWIIAAAAGTPPQAAEHAFQWRPFLAPFHSVVLHLPIGFLTMAGILELYRALRPAEDLRRVTTLVAWISLLTAVLTACLGVLRAGGGEYETRALDAHRLYGLAVPVAMIATLILQRLAYRDERRRVWTVAYRSTLLCAISLLVVAGHYGGNLTHGSKYLVAHAPDFVRELLEEPLVTAATATDEASDPRERLYLQKVQPILSAKCQSCHGPEKQKGGYRLDLPEHALKGGESGQAAIKPGDPTGSHLVRLILLPPGHDDVMPPEGKQPLTPDEVMTLLEWIRDGAVFPTPHATNVTAGP